MTTLFLSVSISAFLDALTGEIDASYASSIKKLAATLRSHGLDVFCGLDAHPSAFPDTSTRGIVKINLEQIAEADILLALVLSSNVSAGQQFEIGYASGLGKKVLIASPLDINLPFMNQGMVELGSMKHIPYTKIEQMPEAIIEVIEEQRC